VNAIATTHEYIEQRGYVAEVIRRPRTKTARLQVDDGTVSIVVPVELPQACIKKILTEKKLKDIQCEKSKEHTISELKDDPEQTKH